MPKSWKDSLLSSGLPLENDVKRFLESRKCVTRFEYSYLKPDEQRIERQFSYDVDASLIVGPHFVDLMVECKYRYPGVRWIFAPDDYGGPDEIYPNDFLHPFDHFVSLRFPFRGSFPRQLAPCCSKGVEVTPDGSNEKAIAQALSQLAFAMAPQAATAMEHQVRNLLVGEFVFYHVPMIVTTAQLFRLRDDVTIGALRSAAEVDEVATEEECLVLKYQPGVELREYNLAILQAAAASLGDEAVAAAMKTFTNDLGHLSAVVADQSPTAVVIIGVGRNFDPLDRVLQYIRDVLEPPEALVAEVRAQHAEVQAALDRIQSARPKPKA